ncbi:MULTISPECIES: tetratricopeptide repeat protein [Actinosynnema]|uniref:tetratricopeptide repeat protein n=1 Tax=Actinosynnema TaxID=40566 RepID=UPI0020A2E2BF|nr:tetratricopeptide repeat protein [Actinosynnema pretiosum]MCP2099924.1 hypothetical protein [Actinosynnema pretiosum]
MRLGRRWLRAALLTSVVLALATATVRWGLWGWLPAEEGPARNVMEGLSWPSTILATVFLVADLAWRWIAQERPPPGLSAPVAVDPLAGRALHLVDGRLPTVAEVGLLALQVKPAIGTHREDGKDLPAYVPRDVDVDLEWAIAQGGMVLLHGPAAAGKSRAAAEALRRLRPSAPLVMPGGGAALRALIEAGAVPAGAVVWLDDLERYLSGEGLDMALLQRLCPQDRQQDVPTVVVATMRKNELARYTPTTKTAEGIERTAVDLVAHVRGRRRIKVNTGLSDAERERATEAAEHDERMRGAAVAPEGFAAYLAAGVQMMDRWNNGGDARAQLGQALVSAAVDCRRAGYHQPVPTALLERLAPHYLPQLWRHRTDLPSIQEALDWAHERVLDADSCLRPHPDGTHLATDYLVDHAQGEETPLPAQVAPETWTALLDTVPAENMNPIGCAAYYVGRHDDAFRAWRLAATTEDPKALSNLGLLLRKRGEAEEAEKCYRRATATGFTECLVDLGLLLFEQGEVEEAEECCRRAVAAGQTEALNTLGNLLFEVGRVEEAEGFYRRAIDAGHTTALVNLGLLLLRGVGRAKEAEEVYRRAVAAGSVDALIALGTLLFERGEFEGAERAYRRAVAAGHTKALFTLGYLLHRLGRVEEAEGFYRRAVAAGHSDALVTLGELLKESKRLDESIEVYQRALAIGRGQLRDRSILLRKAGRFEEAKKVEDYLEQWQPVHPNQVTAQPSVSVGTHLGSEVVASAAAGAVLLPVDREGGGGGDEVGGVGRE